MNAESKSFWSKLRDEWSAIDQGSLFQVFISVNLFFISISFIRLDEMSWEQPDLLFIFLNFLSLVLFPKKYMKFPPKPLAIPVLILAFIVFACCLFGLTPHKELYFSFLPALFLVINSSVFAHFLFLIPKTRLFISFLLIPNLFFSTYILYFPFFLITLFQKKFSISENLSLLNYAFQFLAIAVVSIFPLTKLHYQKSQPLEVTEPVPSIYLYWTKPYQEHAWLIRDHSERLSKFTDPRVYLDQTIEGWLERSPYDELALIEKARFAYKTEDTTEARQQILEAYSYKPDSDILALWVMRAYVEENRLKDALDFLRKHQMAMKEKSDVIDRNIDDLKFALQEM